MLVFVHNLQPSDFAEFFFFFWSSGRRNKSDGY